MKKMFLKVAVLAMTLGLTSSQAAVVWKELQSLSISGSSSVAYNGKVTLTATAKYSDGSSAKVSDKAKWSSSNTAVATVSNAGVVTGKKGGSAKITASYTEEGITKSASFNITVTKKLQSLTVSGTSTVLINGKVTLTATAKYDDGSSGKVTAKWSSSSTAVATVSNAGVVTGKKAGTATITASYTYGNVTKTGSMKVTVAKKLLQSVSLSGGGSSVLSGKTLKFTATAKYSDGSSEKVAGTWKSSNTGVAAVSGGTVTGKKAGTATITVSFTASGITKTASKAITVTKQLQSVSLSGGGSSVMSGKTLKFTATAKYSDGSSEKVTGTWKSSNTGVAAVSKGTVTGKKAGTATITVSFKAGSITKTASKKITVTKQLQSLSISGTKTVAVKKSVTLKATAKFSDGSSSAVKPSWKSSSTAIATVSAAGVVTGKKAGSVTITATYKNGNVSKSATVKITVK